MWGTVQVWFTQVSTRVRQHVVLGWNIVSTAGGVRQNRSLSNLRAPQAYLRDAFSSTFPYIWVHFRGCTFTSYESLWRISQLYIINIILGSPCLPKFEWHAWLFGKICRVMNWLHYARQFELAQCFVVLDGTESYSSVQYSGYNTWEVQLECWSFIRRLRRQVTMDLTAWNYLTGLFTYPAVLCADLNLFSSQMQPE